MHKFPAITISIVSLLTLASFSNVSAKTINIGGSGDILYMQGNVGIGATSTQYNLNVQGTSYISGESYMDGNVGIGTTSPSYELSTEGYGYFAQPVTVGTPLNDTHATTKSFVESYVDTHGGEGVWAQNGSDIYYDSGNVGIGTSTPANSLQVEGNVEASGFTINGTPLGTSNDSYWSSTGDGRIYYDADNVGIGTTNPASQLEVGGTGTSTITNNAGSIVIDPAGNELLPGGDAVDNLGSPSRRWNRLYVAEIVFDSSNVKDLVVTGQTDLQGDILNTTGNLSFNDNVDISGDLGVNGNVTLGDTESDTLTFNASSLSIPNSLNIDSDTLYIDSANNRVGVGSSSPAYKLSTIGYGYYAQPVTVGTPINDTHAATKNYVDTNVEEADYWKPDGADNAYFERPGNIGFGISTPEAKIHSLSTTTPQLRLAYDSNNYVNFQTYSDGDMSLLSTTASGEGNIGIGTSDPVSKLHVKTSADTNSEIDIQSGSENHWAVYHDETSENLRFWNDDISGEKNALTLTNSGKIGIGTTTPNAKLHVQTATNTNAEIDIQSGNENHWAVYHDETSEDLRVWNGDISGEKNTLTFRNNGNIGMGKTDPANKLDISGNASVSGNVGIGTTNPASKLEVSGTGTSTITNNAGSIVIDPAGNELLPGGDAVDNLGSPDRRWNRLYVAEANFSQSTLSDLTVTGQTDLRGNVLDSQGPLTLADNVEISSNLTVNDNTVLGDAAEDTLTFNASTMAIPNSLNIDNDTLVIDSSTGKVGIGSSTPAHKLSTIGYGYFAQPVTVGTPINDTHATTKNYVDNNVEAFSYWDADQADDIYFERAGNVGIGTSTPEAKIHSLSTTTPQLRLAYDRDNYFDFQAQSDGNLNISSETGVSGGGNVGFSTNVGIGTTSPNAKLQVQTDTGTNSEIDIRSGTQNHWAMYHDETTEDLRFWNNDPQGEKDTLTLTNEGDMGVGTTSPNSKLHVKTATNTNAEIDLQTNEQNHWAMYHDESTEQLRFWNDDISDEKNALAISNSGNVGIGTTNPASKLEVSGTGTSTITNNAGSIVIDSAGNELLPGGDAVDNLGSPDRRWNKLYVKETIFSESTLDNLTVTGESDLQGDVTIGGSLNVNSDTLYVDANNRVGLGTASPGQRLSVNGNAMIGGSSWAQGSTSGDLAVEGDVGFGTASPNSRLHIKTDSGTNAEIDVQTASLNHWAIYQDEASEDLRFWNDDISGEKNSLTLTNAGDVGIGTTNPASRLDMAGGNIALNTGWISGDGDSEGIYVDDSGKAAVGTSSPSSQFHVQTESGTNSEINIQSGSENHWAVYHDESTEQLRFWNNDISGEKNALAITNTGNIGIGTTSPDSKFHVKTDSGTNAEISVQSGEEGPWSVYHDESTKNLNFANDNTPGEPESFSLNENGKVGIGTTTPASQLHVQTESGTNSEIDIQSGSENHWAVYHDESTEQLRFWNDDISDEKNALAISNSGNVGIGTTNPASKLEVSGTGTSTITNNAGSIVIDSASNELLPGGDGVDNLGSADRRWNNIYAAGSLRAEDYHSGDGSQGITDNSSYWVCTSSDCSSSCQLNIKDGLIVGCN